MANEMHLRARPRWLKQVVLLAARMVAACWLPWGRGVGAGGRAESAEARPGFRPEPGALHGPPAAVESCGQPGLPAAAAGSWRSDGGRACSAAGLQSWPAGRRGAAARRKGRWRCCCGSGRFTQRPRPLQCPQQRRRRPQRARQPPRRPPAGSAWFGARLEQG